MDHKTQMSRNLFNELDYQGLRVVDNCGRYKNSFGMIHKCEKSYDTLWKCQCKNQSLHDMFLAVWQIAIDRGKESDEANEGYRLLDLFSESDFYVKHLENNECLVYCPKIVVGKECEE